MSAKKTVLLHQYAYDPLDRHVKSGGSQGDETQVFYNNDRVATEIKGNTAYRVFETDNAVLGQLTTTPRGVETALIAHDDKRSTLATLTSEQHTPVAYTAAGYSTADEQRVLGFNGERDDKTTGHYLLGNGYRAFNPVLMRFNSPDSWSPFGDGGINAYAYCDNDPLNKVDPTGHIPAFIKFLLRPLKLIKSAKKTTERINDLQSKINITIRASKIDTRQIASLPETPNTLSRSQLLTRALAAQKIADNAVIAANKLAAKKVYTKLRRSPLDPNTLFRARGSKNNPLPEYNSNAQKNMDSSVDGRVEQLDETARTNYLIAKQYIDKAVNLNPEITKIRTT